MIEPDLTPYDNAADIQNPLDPIGKTLIDDIVPISAINDYDRWVALLYSEENLASAPPIPLDAMRREAIYEGRD